MQLNHPDRLHRHPQRRGGPCGNDPAEVLTFTGISSGKCHTDIVAVLNEDRSLICADSYRLGFTDVTTIRLDLVVWKPGQDEEDQGTSVDFFILHNFPPEREFCCRILDVPMRLFSLLDCCRCKEAELL